MSTLAFEVMSGVKYNQLGFSRWAFARYDPAATAVQAVKGLARPAQPLCASAAEHLVKHATGASWSSVAHTGMHSPGCCSSGGQRWHVLHYAHGRTDTWECCTLLERHSGASSAFSLWMSWRYLQQVGSAGLLLCWRRRSLHQPHIAPELDFHKDSKTEKLDVFLYIMIQYKRHKSWFYDAKYLLSVQTVSFVGLCHCSVDQSEACSTIFL